MSLSVGIIALIIVGMSWCLIGAVMGLAPKKNVLPEVVQLAGAVVTILSSFAVVVFEEPAACSPRIYWMTNLIIAAGGALDFMMLQYMSKAMQCGPNGIIWAFIQSAMVFQFLGGVVIFGEKLTMAHTVGMVLLIASLFLYGFSKDNTKSGNAWKVPALISIICCAIQQNLTTAPSYFEEARAVSSMTRTLMSAVGALIISVIYMLVTQRGELFRKIGESCKNKYFWIFVIGIQLFNLLFSYLLFYPGIDALAVHGQASISYPMMVGSCILAFTLYSMFLLKEKISKLGWYGLFCSIMGIVFLCCAF